MRLLKLIRTSSVWQKVLEKCLRLKIIHVGDAYSKDEIYNKYSLSETGTTYEYGGLAMATVKEVKLMKDEAMIAPVVLVDSVKNLDGTKFKDYIYTKAEIDAKISTLQNSINEASKKVMPKKWTLINQSIFTDQIYGLCYGNGKFIAGDLDGVMAYSTDGISWTKINQSAMGDVLALCYGNGKFIAGGFDGQMAYSTDGISWTKINQSATKGRIEAICYGTGKFVAVGAAKILYSTDGISWTLITQNIFSSYVSGLCYGNGKFVIGGDYNGPMAYSTDGISWTKINQSILEAIKSICYGNGKFIAGSHPHTMAYAYAGPPF